MSGKAKLYISLVIVVGGAILVNEMYLWESPDVVRYLCYLVLAVLSSRLKVTLPGIAGTMSLFFIFVLFGIAQLKLSETMLLGCAATLAQCVWYNRERPKLYQVVFNICNMALAIKTTSYAYHSDVLHVRHADAALLMIVSTIVFYTMNTLPVAAAISLTEGRLLRKVWHECYFWSLPYYLVGAAIAGAIGAVDRYVGWQTALLVVPVVYLVYRSYGLYLGRVEDEKKHAQEMASLHLRTIEALALAIEAKDHTTHDHLKRVQVYALEVAKTLRLSADEIEALRAAALLHDIGKLAVPEHIISKPGKLTREEFDKMKIHPVIGSEILERVRFPYPVTPIVRSHHEKWDGSGYPDGLKGEEIPIGARILAAVDCLDALASDRQYRRALPLDEAMRRVRADAGVAFDPKVVKVLEQRYMDFEQMAASQQNDSKIWLSTGVMVERGLEPAAGFANHDEAVTLGPRPASDFLSSIASARQEVQQLFELAQDLGNSLSLNETLSLLAIRLKKMVPYDSLAMYVQHDEVLKAEYVSGENYRLFSSLEIPLGQGLSGWVAENRKAIVNGNPAVEPGYLNDETKFTTMRSALAVPLIGLSGPVNVLTLYHTERDVFTKDHLRILLAIAPKVALSMENAMKYQQAESSASTDYMTGLPNARSMFIHLDSELSRCRRLNSPLVVLVCDMNGFKQVNDRFGHLEGNKVLRTVATRLKECCREYDYVARMGGDEFVLVLPGLRTEQVDPKVQLIRALTTESGRDVCGDASLSLSVGHASYPEDGEDADQLLAEADRRMYIVKQREKMNAAKVRGFEFDAQPAGTTW
jgi:diguanylate cyclase (GGDEF)-like protein/putative nucleotidyltransferase with HDIG domain